MKRKLNIGKPLNKNCPIRERTGDGVSVGRCNFFTGENGQCPRHGDVREALKTWNETGKMTDERDIPKRRRCLEGGYCEFTVDAEYDASGDTINCEKCGRDKEQK